MPNDRPETLADICARIRTINESMMRDLDFMAVFLKFLPRDIEAAAKRERENDLLRAENEKRKNDLLKANRKIERLSGNIASELKSALIEILDRTNREKARDYDAALNGGILEIHDIANTALNETKGE